MKNRPSPTRPIHRSSFDLASKISSLAMCSLSFRTKFSSSDILALFVCGVGRRVRRLSFRATALRYECVWISHLHGCEYDYNPYPGLYLAYSAQSGTCLEVFKPLFAIRGCQEGCSSSCKLDVWIICPFLSEISSNTHIEFEN